MDYTIGKLKSKKKSGFGDMALDLFAYTFLGIYAVIVILPILNVIFKAVSEDWAVTAGKVGLYPVGFQLKTILHVVKSNQFANSFTVSVLATLIGTVGSIVLTSLTAYPLSKRNTYGMRTLLVLYIFTMLFNGGIVPNYLLFKNLNLLNKFSALILPSMLSVFNMLVVKNYFESIPESLEESAKLDGASNLVVLFKIILPLSMPVLATIGLFYAVGYWNDYFHAMLYVNKPSLKPLQLYLRDVVLSAMDNTSELNLNAEEEMNLSTEGLRSATVVASMIPMMLVYPWLQKYFVKGILIGSVKG